MFRSILKSNSEIRLGCLSEWTSPSVVTPAARISAADARRRLPTSDVFALRKATDLFSKWILIYCLAVGCGGGSAGAVGRGKTTEINAADSPRSDPIQEKAREPNPPERIPTHSTSAESLHLNATPISRVDLLVVLEEGISRFLQNIRVEPRFSDGRFFGWQVVSFFPNDSRFNRNSVRPGDIVIDVNGRSIERPEGLKVVWDGLASASNLRFTVVREGRTYVIDHEITD